MKKQISTQYTIGIREYLNNYLNVKYKKQEKLTHKKMEKYLIEKNFPVPKKISFSKITNEDILTGKYLLVREEVKQKKSQKDSPKKAKICAYSNPIRLDIDRILLKKSKKELERIRKRILNSQGIFCDSYGNLIEDDETDYMTISEKVTRVYKIPVHSFHKGRKR